MTTSDNKPQPLRVGVLILPPVQLLDVSPIDLFGMLSPEYLRACRLPAAIVNLGVPVDIHYISAPSASPSSSTTSSSASSLEEKKSALVECTANAHVLSTATIASEAVAPGRLDILLIPGPEPGMKFAEEALAFIRAHVESERKVTVMSVCTGIYPLVSSGVLEGRMATGPRALVGDLKRTWPGVKWVEKRWVRDGRIWSSGGITNGQDMVAAYLKETYPGALSDTVCAAADVGDRGQEYGTGKMADNAWWFWVVLRAWFSGPTKR